MRLIRFLVLSFWFVVFGQNLSNAQPLLSGYFLLSDSCSSGDFKFCNSLLFDGTDDYVSLTTDFEFANKTSAWSVSWWISMPNSTVYQFSLKTNTGGCFLMAKVSNNIRFGFTGTSEVVPVHNYVWSDYNNWNHFVLTFDGSNYILYNNGVSVSLTTVGPFATQPNNTLIGAVGGAASGIKTIDELAIWNTELDSSDAANLYNSGNGDYATNYSPANLLAYWRCNHEDGGATLKDEQETYNGALNNFSTPPAYFIPH